jgi:hypothetical protein
MVKLPFKVYLDYTFSFLGAAGYVSNTPVSNEKTRSNTKPSVYSLFLDRINFFKKLALRMKQILNYRDIITRKVGKVMQNLGPPTALRNCDRA